MVANYEENYNFCGYSSSTQTFKIKTCTCSIGKETCPSHFGTDRSSGDGLRNYNDDLKISDVSICSQTNLFATDSSVTIIPKETNCQPQYGDELRLSLTSLTTENNEKNKDIVFQKWLSDKNREKTLELRKKKSIEHFLLNEKEKKLELERQNFQAWLKNKKEREKEEQQIIQEQKAIEERKMMEDKEKKEKIAQMKLKLWLKQKEEQLLLNKVQEQLTKIKVEEEKQRRVQESMAAYENWLKRAKTRPKPIPLNQGLDSLRSSVSVSYINPSPWIPNIDKPITK